MLYYFQEGPPRGFVKEEPLVVPPDTQQTRGSHRCVHRADPALGVGGGERNPIQMLSIYAVALWSQNIHGMPEGPFSEDLIDWLCWGLAKSQPLWVILCRLPEKGRKDIEEIEEEMKERNRKERGTGMIVKKQKK